MDLLTDTERQLTAERLLKYQGTAKINLDQISLQPLMSRELDQKNVERLRDIFAKDGCQRLDIRNHVTAIVSRRHLGRACHAVGLTAEELKTYQPQYPHLSFRGHQVQCLHGQHRLKAAEETLPPSDRWWTVDLYLDDISPDLRTTLVDEYANEKAPTDGEVYRKIRQYQHESNALFQNRWLSRLSPNKAKRLRQLTSEDNTHLCAAFDTLLGIPGLWNGMSLGSLNTVMALKCDEELIHYLTHVKNFWATLVDHDRARMALIDLHTVDTLQLYAPRASKVDRKTVKGKILGGEVFSNFNRSERAAIWGKIRSHEVCDGIIPSLHTFFRDISYLELCANAVKRLVLLNKQQLTVRSALVHSFRSRRSDGACLVQTSETRFRRQLGANDERIASGYRQIWMYAMRHYPDMVKDVQRGQKANPTRAKARAKADESVIHGMATLAKKLGFRNPQIKAILRQSPDQQIARAALLKARKPDHYHYDSGTFESLIEQIAGCFALAIPNEAAPVAHITGRAIKLKDRCGAPQEKTQQLDRPHIFLDILHSATVLQRNLSSLEVRRSVYYAFFGKPSSTTLPSAPPGQSSSNEPLSPLFVPDEDQGLQSESIYENMSRSGVGEGSLDGRLDRSGTPEEQHQRQEDRRCRRQERQQAVENDPFLPQEPSRRSSTGRGSTISEVMDLYWDSSDAEDQPRQDNVEQQPAASGGLDAVSEERECTEIDEDKIVNQVEDGSPRTEGQAAIDHSAIGALSDTGMSDIPEGRAAAYYADTGESVQSRSESGEDHTGMPTTVSRQLSLTTLKVKGKNRDATWRPYDATQKGIRKSTRRSLATRGQSITQGDIPNLEPSVEQWPGSGPSQPIGEHAEQEASQSDVPEHIPTRASLAADSQDIDPETAMHPVIERTSTLGDQPQNPMEGQEWQIPDVTVKSNTRAREELAATILGSDAAASQSPETQGKKAALDKDKRRRNLKWAPYFSTLKGNRKKAGQERRAKEAEEQPAAEVLEQERLAKEATERAEFGQQERLAGDEQSETERRRREAKECASPESSLVNHQEGITGEQVAHDMGTTVEAVEELLQGERVARERADALAQLQTPGAGEDHVARPVTELPADLPSLIARLREEGSQLGDNSVIPGNNRIQEPPEMGPATGDNLDRDGGGMTAGAVELGLSQQETERYTADLPDPEQAQREAIERQEGEDLLFDDHVLEESADPAVEEDLERPSPKVPAPLGPGSINERLSSDAPPERRVTVTFHVYEQGAWRKMDMVSVSPNHPTEAYIIADRYARDPSQNARFFDGRLRKVAVNECVRAAIDDGSFAVLMSFGKDLVVTRHLVASVAQLFRTVESEWQDPYHPEKRLKANTGAPSAGPVQTQKNPAPTETTATTQSETERRNRRKLRPQIVALPAQDVQPSRAEANPQPVTILFRDRETNGRWKTAHKVLVDRSDPSEVERVARKEARNHQAIFYDKNLRKLTPAQCFEAAIEDDTNTIFMNFEGELAINEDTLRSIAQDLEI
ncbi:hypothetical protein BJX70DRAFT_48849 [Aspergillus crustosus]